MIDLNKKYKTRGGHEVQLVGRSADNSYPIVGCVRKLDNGGWENMSWTQAGRFLNANHDSKWDLIEVPTDIAVRISNNNYIKVFSDGSARLFTHWEGGCGEFISSSQMQEVVDAYNKLTKN